VPATLTCWYKKINFSEVKYIIFNYILVEWLRYFEDLRTHRSISHYSQHYLPKQMLTDDITMERQKAVSKILRQHKAAGEDKLNLQVFK
jgi:hypothetical protein